MAIENTESNSELSNNENINGQKESIITYPPLVNNTDSEEDPEHGPQTASDAVRNSPLIPLEIYELLPEVLKNGAKIYGSHREKDSFLTSAITVLSGCFPSVQGIYDGKKVNANLFSFVIAPAASGKSALIGAKDLGLGIHNVLINQSSEDGLTIDPSEESTRRILYLPGNISAAAIISILHDNNGIGIICESEADSLGNCFKQDWGGFSDVLRKAFHHEHISYARKQRNQFIEIPKPRLSVSLSGTPNQVSGIIRSIQDGLFSRFIFYIFRNAPVWRDPSPAKSEIIYDTYMAGLQEHITTLYTSAKNKEYSFDLTVFHWLKLNATYSKALRDSVTFIGDETAGSIFRLGLIHFRIAMVLSILRFFESPQDGNAIPCSDKDYSIAETLCDVYLRHGSLVYKILTNQFNSGLGESIEKFYKALPSEPFKRKDAIGVGDKLGAAERTVNNYLKKLKENCFLKQDIPQGPYQKVV